MDKRRITDDEAKRLLIGYLEAFALYCERNGLKYFLAGGTLLGAVRHSGFIPWDDDVDVMMPRPDYDKFLDLTRREPVGDGLTVMEPRTGADYLWPFAKLVDRKTSLAELQYKRKFTQRQREGYGLYIDIFPLDGLPDTREEQVRHMNAVTRATRGLQRATYHIRDVKPLPRRLFRMLIYPVYALIGHRWFLRRLEAFARKYEYDRHETVAAAFGSYGTREIMPKACFESAVPVEFEGRQYNAPAGYERYLSSLYGDYMKLPPENKRITHHKRELYWAD